MTWKGGEFVPTHRFRQFFQVQYLNLEIMPAEATWYVISDKNSHGVILERFFDGNCEKNVLSSNYSHTLTVIEVKEHINLEPICSSDSYYECLAKRFAKVEFTEISSPEFEQHKSCSYEKVCCPFRLPFAEDSIPLCESNIEANCYESIMKELWATQEKYSQHWVLRLWVKRPIWV